jgi:flagellar motor switch protein FliG
MSVDLLARSGAAGALRRAQKAAAVLLAVGPEAAAGVLAHFNEVEVESLALEVATLGQLQPEIVTAVLEEFHTEAVAQAELISGGEDHARTLLRQWRGSEGDEIVDRLLANVRTAPFSFLRYREPTELVQHLADEHPQTVALILAHLPAKFSAAVLAGLEPDFQADVALRIATMDSTSPEVVARVEAALQARLGEATRGDRSERGGVAELAAMLNNSDRGTERAILGMLEVSDPELAEEVRGLMFVFEDITTLDDRAVQEVLRGVEGRTLALALKGVRPDVKDTVLRNLSERARETLREDSELLGPVRLADVEAAQSEIVRCIRKLEEAGTIVISRGNDGDFVE